MSDAEKVAKIKDLLEEEKHFLIARTSFFEEVKRVAYA